MKPVLSCLASGLTCAALAYLGITGVSAAVGMPPEAVVMAWCWAWIAFTAGATVLGPWLVAKVTTNWRLTDPKRPQWYQVGPGQRVRVYPQTVRLELREPERKSRIAYRYLPKDVTYADLRRVALAVLDGAEFSYPGLVESGIISRARFKKLREWSLEMGWYCPESDASNSGVAQTRAGRAAMTAIARSATPLPGMLSQ